MQFEIEPEPETGAKRVRVTPSSRHGFFVYNPDGVRSIQATKRAFMPGLQDETVAQLERGELELNDIVRVALDHTVRRADGELWAVQRLDGAWTSAGFLGEFEPVNPFK